jgi:hypothetical protein
MVIKIATIPMTWYATIPAIPKSTIQYTKDHVLPRYTAVVMILAVLSAWISGIAEKQCIAIHRICAQTKADTGKCPKSNTDHWVLEIYQTYIQKGMTT